MKPATWRAILLSLCAAGTLLVVVAVFDQAGFGGARPWYGIWGGYFTGSSLPYHLTFRGVDPGGPAERAGVREGDLIDLRDHTLAERLAMFGQPMGGRPFPFRITRGETQTEATVVPGRFVVSRFWNYVFWELAAVWLLLFAALIAWRRPYADSNLLLCGVLVCAAIGLSVRSLFFAWPSAWPYIALAVFGQAGPLSLALWAALAGSFAHPLSKARRIALWLCYALVAVTIVVGSGTTDDALGIAPLLGTITLWFDPARFFGAAWTLPNDAAVVSALVCSVMAFAAARGIQRQRAGWLLIPLMAVYVTFQIANLSLHFLSYQSILIVGQAFSVAALMTPVVLSYAALNRRLIDLGFVLNRTVVFAIVSTIVIGTFVLVEWAVGTWLVNASHTTSVIAGMIVALGLGFSMRYIHRYVDRFVDALFFRKRHEDESALRRFAYESSFITDVSTLLERTVFTVRAHTTAEFAEVFLRNGLAGHLSPSCDGAAPVSENDPAILALSAWNKPVDLHSVRGSGLSGDLAFPMISRGRLVGALICGPKKDGETYAPDESDALLALAHGVGGALDVLDSKGERNGDPIGQLRDSIRALTDATVSLPDAIAKRLRAETSP